MLSCYHVSVDRSWVWRWYVLAHSAKEARKKAKRMAKKMHVRGMLCVQEFCGSGVEELIRTDCWEALPVQDKVTALIEETKRTIRDVKRTNEYVKLMQLLNSLEQEQLP